MCFFIAEECFSTAEAFSAFHTALPVRSWGAQLTSVAQGTVHTMQHHAQCTTLKEKGKGGWAFGKTMFVFTTLH